MSLGHAIKWRSVLPHKTTDYGVRGNKLIKESPMTLPVLGRPIKDSCMLEQKQACIFPLMTENVGKPFNKTSPLFLTDLALKTLLSPHRGGVWIMDNGLTSA